MNKHLYKVIFNQERGQMMVVPENATAQGQSSTNTSAENPVAEPVDSSFVSGCLKPLTFSLMLMFGTAFISETVEAANIQADKNAPKNEQPIVLQTPNGLPQVNIQTPSKAGVSVNQYRQFDVDEKGAILNNSRTNTQTQQAGWIQGNPLLATGEAKIIVNQVNSQNPSLLNGYVEVGGKRAEVILANPAGIQVNGGGFINAQSATLSTGQTLIRSGQLDQYAVHDGKISIKGKGLNAKDTDFTKIIGRYVEVDAPIAANDLTVIAGQNTVAADGKIQAAAKNTPKQKAVAIDTSELGGMYANKITLISTENNQSIDNKGQVFANAGGVTLDSQGNLSNAGTIASQGKTDIKAKDLDNSGTLSSKDKFDVKADNVDNSGTVLAANELNARVLGSMKQGKSGHIEAARLDVETAKLDNAGTISQTGLQGLAIESTGALTNSGKIGYPEADNTVPTTANGGTTGTTTPTQNTPSSATGSGNATAVSSPSSIQNFATGSLKTRETLNNSGTINANGGVDLTAKNGLKNTAELQLNKLAVSGNTLDNRQGKIDAQTAEIQTNQWLNQQGAFQTAKQLSSQNTLIDNTEGKIVSAGSIDLKSNALLNKGTLSAKQKLSIDLKDDFKIERDLIAGDELYIQTQGNLDNTKLIQAGSLVKLGAEQNIINRGTINSNGLTRVQAAQTLDNVGTGQIYGDDVQISAQTLHNREEKQADDTIKSATIAARNRLDIGVQNLVNQEHAILFSAGDLHIGGELNAQNQAAGVANDVKNLSATIEALGNGSISSRNLLNKNEHFTITPHVATGEEQSFHEISPEGQPNRRIDMNLLKKVHFSRAGKWVFKNSSEMSDAEIELGKTPIPNLFELKHGSDSEYLDYALYLPNHEVWAYFGIEAPQTQPPMLPKKAFNEPLPTGLKEEDCTADNPLCADYLAKEKAYEESIKPYSDWLEANQAAYDALSQKIEAYNQSKLGEEFKNFTIYTYTRRHYQDEVGQSDPAIIAVGGNLSLSGGAIINDKSRIVVGKTLLGGLDKINNIDAPAFQYQEDKGTSQYTKSRWRGGFKRYHQRDWDDKNDYAHNLTTPILLTVAEKSENTAISPTVEAPTNALIEPAKLTDNQKAWVTLPNNSLFTTNPQHHEYLIETNPQFADYRRWLGSDYMLNALKNDPNHTHKRLGDGFYEQRLLREQIVNLTGQRFLNGYSNDEEQFKSLMNNGLTFAQSHNLRVGITLSAEQVANLTSDIVWLEYQHVKLPNGTVEQVLVPKVYVVPRSGDLKDTGALIAAQDLKLDVSGSLTNAGTLNARNVMVLNADNVEMLGEAQGKTVAVSAQNNVDITGGQIRAQDGLYLQAAGDININSTTSTNHVSGHNFTGSNTNLARVAGLYVTGETGSLAVSADNIRLAAAVVNNAGSGDVVLAANQSLQIGSLETSHKRSTISDANNYLIESQSQEIGSQINGKGNVHLQSKGSTQIRASQINSEMGQLSVSARDLQVVSGEKRSEFAESHVHKHKGTMGGSSRERRYDGAQTESLASTLTGKTVALNSETDILVSGSQIISDEQTNIVAKGDVRLEAAENRQSNHTYSKDSRSGVMGTGGTGLFIGRKQTTDEQDNTSLTHTASTVGSLKGNTTIVAGKNYEQTGSIVRSVEGDTLISAQKIDVKAAENRYTNDHIHTEQQKGLTVAVNVPVVQLAQSALAIADTAKQVGQSKNDRVNAMAAANTAWQAYETGKSATEMMGQDGKPLDVSVSLTYGEQKNRHESHRTATEAESSLVQSGGTSTLIATGAGKESDIHITGSDVLGGKGTYLLADDAINLTSAQQRSTENSSNKSSGWNAGISASYGQNGMAFGITAGGNYGKGHGNGESLTHRHTQVGDSNSATVLQSGGKTTIKGAQVHGKGIDLSAQDLLIESVQDTEKFNSKQQNISGQVTAGYGASFSGSYSQSKVNADHASVNQQSGLYAGDEGYRVQVAHHTDLKGALITSTAKAEADGKNQFSTKTLSHSDIENHSHYDAKGFGIGGGMSVSGETLGQGKYDPNGKLQHVSNNNSVNKSMGYGSDGESQSSVTKSGINTKNIQIQQDPTGELAKSVYTDITTETAAQHSGSLKNSFDKDKVQQEIDLQVKVIQDFNRNVQAANGEINKQIDKLKQQLDKGKISQEEYDRKVSNWQHGSVLLNSIAAGLGAPTDSVAGIATATLAPAVSYQIGQEFKKTNEEGSLKHILAHAIVGAVVAQSGGNNALAGALSAGGAEAIAPKVAEYLYGKKGSELNAEQKETVSSIMSLAGAATGAAVGNSSANATQGSLNAESAVENNAFLFEERDALVEELRKSPQSKHNEIIEKYKKYGEKKAEQDFALCLGKGDKCHLDAIEKLRNINAQSEVFLRSLAGESEIKSAALLTIKLNNEEISWHQSQLSVRANALDKAIQIAPALVGMGTIAGSKLLTSKTKTEIKDVKNLGNHGQTQKTMSPPVDGKVNNIGRNNPKYNYELQEKIQTRGTNPHANLSVHNLTDNSRKELDNIRDFFIHNKQTSPKGEAYMNARFKPQSFSIATAKVIDKNGQTTNYLAISGDTWNNKITDNKITIKDTTYTIIKTDNNILPKQEKLNGESNFNHAERKLMGFITEQNQKYPNNFTHVELRIQNTSSDPKSKGACYACGREHGYGGSIGDFSTMNPNTKINIQHGSNIK